MDIRQEVAEGRFREDLLYRLNTVEIHLPALRDRREDIPLLANHFLARQAGQYRKRAAAASRRVRCRRLLAYEWPGNIRELEHTVERAVLLAHGDMVQPEDLNLRARRGRGPRPLDEMPLEEVERLLIQKALKTARRQRQRTPRRRWG